MQLHLGAFYRTAHILVVCSYLLKANYKYMDEKRRGFFTMEPLVRTIRHYMLLWINIFVSNDRKLLNQLNENTFMLFLQHHRNAASRAMYMTLT